MASAATSIKLDPGMKERVERLAEARDRSAHWVMKRAIEDYVEREERRENFARESREALEEYRATGLHLTHEEVMDWLERRSRGEEVPLPPLHT